MDIAPRSTDSGGTDPSPTIESVDSYLAAIQEAFEKARNIAWSIIYGPRLNVIVNLEAFRALEDLRHYLHLGAKDIFACKESCNRFPDFHSVQGYDTAGFVATMLRSVHTKLTVLNETLRGLTISSQTSASAFRESMGKYANCIYAVKQALFQPVDHIVRSGSTKLLGTHIPLPPGFHIAVTDDTVPPKRDWDTAGFDSSNLGGERSPSSMSTNTLTEELLSFSKRLQARLGRHESRASRSTYFTTRTGRTDESNVTYTTVRSYASGTRAYDHPVGPDTFWQARLRLGGFDPSPNSAIDWSGRGQHVEYYRGESVPLTPVDLLGQGGAAFVESVKCRRILLARKSMRCSNQFRREECIKEARILDKLRHPHIVQLVGTYVQGNRLAILMYPVADLGSLDVFLNQFSTLCDIELSISFKEYTERVALARFPKCLASALQYIHDNLVKHLDVKPKNVLVRRVSTREGYRVYVTDFGISRSYSDEANTETDSPVSFTKTYCAPEVARQDKRGRAADVYSLGCIFAEIYTVLSGDTVQALTTFRQEPFHQRTSEICRWIEEIRPSYPLVSPEYRQCAEIARKLIPDMLFDDPTARSGLDAIIDAFEIWKDKLQWTCCQQPPENYQCYEDLINNGGEAEEAEETIRRDHSRHHRSSSTPIPYSDHHTMSSGNSALISGAIMSGATTSGGRGTPKSGARYTILGGRDSRNSRRISGASFSRKQISAPVMAENSLGWN